MSVRVTYYLDVMSSWCFHAEPAWAGLKEAFAGRVEFGWKIALLDASGLPASRAQEDWFYRRSGILNRSPLMLNSGWFEADRREYLAPNALAEAARDFGVTDDRVRLALARAALIDGRPIGRWEVALTAAMQVAGLDAAAFEERARSPQIEARLRASTAEFHAFQITQRPAFLVEDDIGDRAVFSGLVTAEPLAAAIETMLHDSAGYASFQAHFGAPPKA